MKLESGVAGWGCCCLLGVWGRQFAPGVVFGIWYLAFSEIPSLRARDRYGIKGLVGWRSLLLKRAWNSIQLVMGPGDSGP
jgi:hypothetical protein